jgi:HlyD family secretion protein
MIATLKELYSLLSSEHKKKLFFLQFWIVLMSLLEVLSVLSIGPFMALVANTGALENNPLLAEIYQFFGLIDTNQFLIIAASLVLILLTLSAFISMFTIWQLSMQGSQIGADLSNRLFKYYLGKDWLFHTKGNSTILINKIMAECNRITSSVLIPLLQMYAKLVMTVVMSIAIFIYNPAVASLGICIFASCYYFLYLSVRLTLDKNGQIISDEQALRFKILGEGFGGIKDILLSRRQHFFIDKFFSASNRYAYVLGNTTALGLLPRYIMELVSFGSIISLVLVLLIFGDNTIASVLPVLSVFALAGFKLLPAFQLIYSCLASIKSNLAAFENLKSDFMHINLQEEIIDVEPSEEFLPFNDRLTLSNVSFEYLSSHGAVLNDVSFDIPCNNTIGIVGSSGSGKSTLIDLILGLIHPDKGSILLDGLPITKANIALWQNSIGFVPQTIFLADASIRENIAFGILPAKIKDSKINQAVALSNLDTVLDNLPDGIETRVGERGVQLSGGQRQRVGIARAVYSDAPVLILDEATSSLDGITEKIIMESIHHFSGSKTIIIIAHRLSTVKSCDFILLLEDGKVVDQGPFDELVSRNDYFKKMSENS